MSGNESGKNSRLGYSLNNSVQLLRSGTVFFDTIESLIDAAEHEIHFQTYIFAEDETGRQIAGALIRAANRGVKIFLLLDAFGSNDLSNLFVEKLKNENIQFRWFGPLFRRGALHIGRRLHRKVIVIDGHTSVVSGINISNNYNDLPGDPAWLDFGVVVKGDVSEKLNMICKQSWYKIRFRRLSRTLKQEVHTGFRTAAQGVKIRVRQNDWKIGKSQSAKSYYKLIRHASQSITIVGGYFLPGRKARRLLKKAAERGVVIRLVVAERSDVGMMRRAILYLYDLLLRNKIQIFEYLPSNVHGKVIIADQKYVSIGSYDLNTLSTYSNIELNLDIDNENFAADFFEEVQQIIGQDCKEITAGLLKTRSSIGGRFLQWLSYRMVKGLFVLSVWLSTKEKGDRYQ